MELLTQIQILDDILISFYTYALGKGINLYVHSPAIDK